MGWGGVNNAENAGRWADTIKLINACVTMRISMKTTPVSNFSSLIKYCCHKELRR
jgi:hypothetical protein